MNPQKQFCYSSLYQSCANNHPHPEVVGGGECFAGGGGNEDKIMVWSEPMQLHDGTAVVTSIEKSPSFAFWILIYFH